MEIDNQNLLFKIHCEKKFSLTVEQEITIKII